MQDATRASHSASMINNTRDHWSKAGTLRALNPRIGQYVGPAAELHYCSGLSSSQQNNYVIPLAVGLPSSAAQRSAARHGAALARSHQKILFISHSATAISK